MSLFSALKRKRVANKTLKAQHLYSSNYSGWKSESVILDDYITIVRDCVEGRIHEQLVDRSDYGFLLEVDEIPVAFLPVAVYVEVVAAPSPFNSGYGGVSFPLFERVRMNLGRAAGEKSASQESVETTDEGVTLITTERIMFSGSARTREWKFDSLMSIAHHPAGYSVFSPKRSGKPAGIAFGPDVATEVQFRIELGSAIARNQLAHFLGELEAEKAHHVTEMPVPPVPVT